MIEKRSIQEVTQDRDGEAVTVTGFVEVIRDQKRMQFVILRDSTGRVQLVNDREARPEVAEVISQLTAGSAVEARGRIAANPSARLGGVEILLSELIVHGLAESPLPIDDRSSEELQLDWRALSLRTPRWQLIMRVQTAVERAMREFWHNQGFIEIHSPKLMGTASESGSELFTLPYFGKSASLAQSPQFYKQLAMAAGIDRVFEIGPVFRANPSFTSRHDTEFTSVDMEMAWIDSPEDVMAMEELWLQWVIQRVAEELKDEIHTEFGVELIVPTVPFPRITLAEAQEIAKASGHIPFKSDDLDPESERALSRHVMSEFGHEFVFVTEWPSSARPFYHMREADAPGMTRSFDLLWKGLEITTGAQREHRLEQLRAQALEKGLDEEPLRNYLDSFRYGCPPHGGCGIGLTRILMILLGLKSVREVTFVYRGPNRLTP
ncbi:aspartate--tRNA(Asn) ligase [bacterium]|nr:aspartate--tRNA(Asn) ligase [bacterium]